MAFDEEKGSGLSPENLHPRGHEQFDAVSGGLLVRENEELETRKDSVDARTTIVGRARLGALTSDDVWQLQRITLFGSELLIDWPINPADSKPSKRYLFSWDDRTTFFGAIAGAVTSIPVCKIVGSVIYGVDGVALGTTTVDGVPGLNVNIVNELTVAAPKSRRITTMTVGDTATLIPTGGALTDRVAISIVNFSTLNTVYFNDSVAVTADRVAGTTSGWEIGPEETYNESITDSDSVFGRCEAGQSALIKVMEWSKA